MNSGGLPSGGFVRTRKISRNKFARLSSSLWPCSPLSCSALSGQDKRNVDFRKLGVPLSISLRRTIGIYLSGFWLCEKSRSPCTRRISQPTPPCRRSARRAYSSLQIRRTRSARSSSLLIHCATSIPSERSQISSRASTPLASRYSARLCTHATCSGAVLV